MRWLGVVPAVGDAPAPGLSAATRHVLLAIAFPVFLSNLDSRAMGAALPTVAQAFGCDPQRMGVVMTSMAVTLVMFVPASGWIADRFGPRNVLRVAMALFMAGAIGCGLAGSLSQMVLARCLQGLGAALMVPVARTLLVETTDRGELALAMSWQAPPALAGVLLGPLVAGLVVTHLGWRWLPGVTLVVGSAGLLAMTRWLPDVPARPVPRFDLRGLVLVGIALAGLMVGLETAGRDLLPAAVVVGALVAGVVGAAGYAWHLRRFDAPIVDLGLCRLPSYGHMLSANLLFRIASGTMPFLLPMALQVGLGWTPVQAGLVMVSGAAVALPLSPMMAPVLRRFGFRASIVCCATLLAMVFALCAVFDAGWPTIGVCAVLVVYDVVLGIQLTAFNSLAYAGIPGARKSAATTLNYAGNQLAPATGIALSTMTLDLADPAFGLGGTGPVAFWIPFLLIGALALAAAPLAWRLPDDTGDELSGRQPGLAR